MRFKAALLSTVSVGPKQGFYLRKPSITDGLTERQIRKMTSKSVVSFH